MELLLASLIRHRLNSEQFDPDGSDPFEAACFCEWLDAVDDWEKKVLAAAKAIGARPDAPPSWALLTCFVWMEDEKHKTSRSSDDAKVGYALDLLIFYLLEANERHWSDVENERSRQKPGHPQAEKPYQLAKSVSLDKAARWVCGENDEEFEESELILRKKLRRPEQKDERSPDKGEPFGKRTLLRAWKREQDEAPIGGNEVPLVDDYKNTERIKRVAEIWAAWRSSLKDDPENSMVASDYAGLFKLLAQRSMTIPQAV